MSHVWSHWTIRTWKPSHPQPNERGHTNDASDVVICLNHARREGRLDNPRLNLDQGNVFGQEVGDEKVVQEQQQVTHRSEDILAIAGGWLVVAERHAGEGMHGTAAGVVLPSLDDDIDELGVELH